MIQVLPRVQQHISYGAGTTYWTVNDGGLDDGVFSTPSRIPLPWPVTLRNLTLLSYDSTRSQDIAVAVMKNNVATDLTGILPSAENGPIVVPGIDVAYAALDDFGYRTLTGLAADAPGNLIGWSVDAVSQGNIFGVHPAIGNFGVGTGSIAGALGNGIFQSYDIAIGPTRSSSYSICAVPGRLTHLALKGYGASTGGSWVGYYIVDDIAQDGTGGTVDTRCELLDGSSGVVATFSRPLAIGDHVDVAIYRTGSGSGFEIAHVGVGVGFVPSIAGRFMLTGGSNQVVGADTAYVWMLSRQEESDETLALAPIGPSGLVAHGLYVERGAPGPDDSFINTLRKNQNSTALTATLEDDETSGLIDNLDVVFAGGDTIDMQSIASAGADSNSRLHWGLDVGVADDVTTGQVGVIGPHIFVIFPRTQPDDLGSP